MGTINVHGGSFPAGVGVFEAGSLRLKTEAHRVVGEKIPMELVDSVQAATQDNVKRMAGSAGWGIVGGLALGPVGALAGVLAGGNKTEITFLCLFRDERQFVGTTDISTYATLAGAVATQQSRRAEILRRGEGERERQRGGRPKVTDEQVPDFLRDLTDQE
jgi:hypothetical protein